MIKEIYQVAANPLYHCRFVFKKGNRKREWK